ncbi:DUF305 domain-containing protein [Phycicoccus sp. CSK15P-2]|uniref:DUF305 domain-containing protein n=1 Tax=Phycicoccus sp. CSK15P-2 TaxID=2807627 RepID=UPI0019503930|nr:DUF305 domain-containing protein [Phycicoccus sp. CSK15P-2]MBM6403274.1 DUF305 domain-containing protein [Phycicoccus sp. CSK15P-2]
MTEDPGLTAASSQDEWQNDGHVGDRRGAGPSAAVLVGTAVAALVIGALGAVLVLRGTDGSSVPDTGVDAGFARDMQTHHRQAVEMGFLVRDRTDDPAVRTLAFDIITSQQQQAGQMYGWLVQWDLPQTGPRAPMAWVGGEHAAHGEADEMPGMATDAQLDELRAARGVAAERIFLRLMIAHHEGGVDMAKAALADATTDEVRTLADAIDRAQTTEITLMETMLADRE